MKTKEDAADKASRKRNTKELKDEHRLRRFVEKVNAEARKRFTSDGDCYLDINIRDTRRHQPTAGLPVPHIHLLNGDKQWREAISFLICNASSALDKLSTAFRVYEHDKNHEENLDILGKELIILGAKMGVDIFYAKHGIVPQLASTKKWVGIKWGTPEHMRAAYCETHGLGPEDRKEVLEFVALAVAELKKQEGEETATFLFSVHNGMARVYAMVGKKQEDEA